MGAVVSFFVVAAMVGLFAKLPEHYEQSRFQFPEKPILLSVKTGDNNDQLEHISFRELLESRCKSLWKPFKPVWWLANGHLQTMYCALGNFANQDQMWYRRTYLKTADDGTLGLDFTPVDQLSLANDTPIVVVQHGLTGGSYEPYVRAILSRACASVKDGGLGYRAVVINFRGCAGVPVTSARLYSGCHTGDTRDALRYIAHMYPNAPLLGVGFSLGANVITRYLGEERELTRLHAACVLACPWNLKKNSVGLMSSFVNKNIYAKAMGANLTRLIKRHLKSIEQFPNSPLIAACYKLIEIKNPTLNDYDETVTRIAGGAPPDFPFANADEYYLHGSSDTIVHQIDVPFIAINASDDPVVKYAPMDCGGNGNVVMQLTKGGGHLGWFEYGVNGAVTRWTTEPVLEWLKLMGEQVVHRPRGSDIFVDDHGLLRERAHPSLSCIVKEGGGVIDGNGGEDGIIQGL